MTDLKVKRRLLEIYKEDLIKSMVQNMGVVDFKEELNPKVLPGAFKFYAHPRDLIKCILINHIKDIKVEEKNKVRSMSLVNFSKDYNKKCHTVITFGLKCFKSVSKTKEEIQQKLKLENKKKFIKD